MTLEMKFASAEMGMTLYPVRKTCANVR